MSDALWPRRTSALSGSVVVERNAQPVGDEKQAVDRRRLPAGRAASAGNRSGGIRRRLWLGIADRHGYPTPGARGRRHDDRRHRHPARRVLLAL